MAWRRRWLYVLVVALVLAAVAGCAGEEPGSPTPLPTPRVEAGPARVDAPAPDFTLPTLSGGTISLSDLRGRPVMLNFWASWCEACRAEMPYLQAVAAASGEEDPLILTINIQEGPGTVRRFVEERGLTFEVALDISGEVARSYGVYLVPASYFIDRQGVLLFVKVGPYSKEEQLRADLEKTR